MWLIGLLEDFIPCLIQRWPDDALEFALIVEIHGHAGESGVIIFISFLFWSDVPERAICALLAPFFPMVKHAFFSARVQRLQKMRRNSEMISHGSVEVLRARPLSEESQLTLRESYTLGRP